MNSISLFELVFSLQLLSSYFLTGLIWIVQRVHYPSFHYIEEKKFTDFQEFHSKHITRIVMPVMFIELITAFILILAKDLSTFGFLFFVCNFFLVVIIWLSTFFFSVPCHNKLARIKDSKTVEKLINTNWLRTICWSLKSAMLLYWTLHS